VEGQSAAHIYWTDGTQSCDIIAASQIQSSMRGADGWCYVALGYAEIEK